MRQDETQSVIHQVDVGPPPGQADILVNLFDLAEIGGIKGIREQIAALEALDEQDQPFVVELRQLAKRYRIGEIQALVKPYVVTGERSLSDDR